MRNIWVIDDDTGTCRDVIEYWKRLSVGYPFRFRLFSTASQALATLWSLPPHGKSMPQAIIVDGHLRRDEGELRDGATVIREIIRVSGQGTQRLVAWTADPWAEVEMKSAGAEATFGKTNPKELILFLQKEYGKTA